MRALVLVALLLAGLPALAATRFLTGSEDVPLMDGLAEVADTSTIFDTPGGRIVEVDAKGAVAAADILRYYAESLPALGWVADPVGENASLTFRRGAEILVITIMGEPGAGGVVRFNLRPRAS